MPSYPIYTLRLSETNSRTASGLRLLSPKTEFKGDLFMSRVLIADDSAFMRRVLREILADGGYDVVSECKNGLEAIQNYKEVLPDLVLMDYNMPKMNGVEGARNILKHDTKACIVMVTSIGGKKKILEALRIGVKNYITKPFENQAFLSTLKKVMGDKAPIQSKQYEESNGEFQIIGSFFGQYLLQKGIISKEQLLQLLEIQSQVNRKIGQLAVESGFLLPKHVESILKVQKRINKYFGQLTMQMGLLDEQQITQLLDIQNKNFVPLEEVIIREGILPKEVIEKELTLFKTYDEGDQGVFNMRWVSKHIQNGFIYETFIEQTLKLLMRLAGIFVMEGECTFERKEFEGHGVLIKLAISGDRHWSYFLNLGNDLSDQIADAMLEADESEEDFADLSIEAANEFVNIACGNAIGKLDSKGVKFEISPPATRRISPGEKFTFSEKEQVLSVPILIPEGEMELIIAGNDIFRSVEE